MTNAACASGGRSAHRAGPARSPVLVALLLSLVGQLAANMDAEGYLATTAPVRSQVSSYTATWSPLRCFPPSDSGFLPIGRTRHLWYPATRSFHAPSKPHSPGPSGKASPCATLVGFCVCLGVGLQNASLRSVSARMDHTQAARDRPAQPSTRPPSGTHPITPDRPASSAGTVRVIAARV